MNGGVNALSLESSGMWRCVVTLKWTEVSDEIALMMEAVRTSETLVHFNVTTRRYIPEDSKLHTRRRENLKCHKLNTLLSSKFIDCSTCVWKPKESLW
jgi:hypothetical protein